MSKQLFYRQGFFTPGGWNIWSPELNITVLYKRVKGNRGTNNLEPHSSESSASFSGRLDVALVCRCRGEPPSFWRWSGL